MSLFEKLSDEEVLALTDEQVERHVRLGCAEAGAKIVTNPGDAQFLPVPQGEVVLFEVDGVSVLFRHRPVAEAVRSILVKERESLTEADYDYTRTGSEYRKMKPFHLDYHKRAKDIAVTEQIVYSEELYSRVVADVMANKQIEKDHEAAVAEYKRANGAYQEVNSAVWERVRAVRAKQARREAAWGQFKEYVALAEGNREQGMAFYRKAYAPDQDTVAYIDKKIAEEVAAAAVAPVTA